MTGREKILAALSPRGTTSTPIVICYPEIFMRECWEKVTKVPWWGMFSHDIEMALQAHRDLLDVTGEDRIRLWMSPPRAEREVTCLEGLDDRRARLVDVRSGQVIEELLRPPPGGFVSEHDRHILESKEITSRHEIDEALPLPPVETRESLEAAGRLDKPKQMLQEFGSEKMPWTQFPSPFDPLPHVFGFEGLMLAVMTRPDLVEYACRRVVECNKRRIRSWKAVGVELIWLEEGMSDQISPAQHRRLVLPYTQQTTADMRRAGLKTIYYYTGNPNDRLDVFLESGADALALEESRKNFVIDIHKIAEYVDGRMALVGNLDEVNVLEPGPVEAIRAEVARQLEAGRRNGGRFLMGIGGPVTPNTPMKHVRAIADAVHELAP